MIPQNLFPARKKAPQKMARPVPVYMEVTPPGEGDYMTCSGVCVTSLINQIDQL